MDGNSPADSKIHILYLVSRAPGVSYQMLMDKCMQSLYLDFFSFSQAYNELISGNLMDRSEEDTGTAEVVGINETLSITPGGLAILEDLIPSLNPQVRSYLERASAELSADVKALNSVKAVISNLTTAHLTDTSGTSGINGSVSITVECNTPAEAEALCKAWRNGGNKAVIDAIAGLSGTGDSDNDKA